MLPLKHASFPFEVEWNLTWACNASCHFCSTGQYDLKQFDRDWHGTLREIESCSPIFVTLTGGEPLLHPDFSEIFQSLVDVNQRVNITTNGRLLKKKLTPAQLRMVNWIRVSIHAGNEETARSIMGHGYSLAEVIENVAYARNSTERISAYTVLTRENCSEIRLEELFQTAASVRIRQLDFGITKLLGNANLASLPDQQDIFNAISHIERLSAFYSIDSATPTIGDSVHNCTSLSYSLAIMPNHLVGDCTFAGDAVIGNIDLETIRDIWHQHTQRSSTCNKCRKGGYFNDHRSSANIIPINLSE